MTPKKNPNYERALKRPFPLSSISFRRGPGGSKELAYITARDAMQRLDDVFGVGGWQTRYEYIGERIICYLSCNFAGEWITKADGADDTQIEGAKGGLSDALKRAAVQFGIARYLYHPGAFNGRTPAKWATPEGYDEIMAEREGAEIEDFRKALKKAAKAEDIVVKAS
jgi:hypothetical protein